MSDRIFLDTNMNMVHSSLGLFSEAIDIRFRHRTSRYDLLIVGAAARRRNVTFL